MRPADSSDQPGGAGGGPGRGDFRKDVDAIRDDLNLLKSDLVAAMRDLVDTGREGGAEARQRLEEAVQQRLEALNAATADLNERGRSLMRDVSKHVHEKPMQTLAIAFGAGFIAGAILTRR